MSVPTLKAPTLPATNAKRSKLYAAAWSLVSWLLVAYFTVRAFERRNESVPDELLLAWCGALFDSVWTLIAELRGAWHRYRAGRISLMFALATLGLGTMAFAFGGSGCALFNPHEYDEITWDVHDGASGTKSCRVVLWGDGDELGEWMARLCPEALLRTPPRLP